jgi:hypothetical protein
MYRTFLHSSKQGWSSYTVIHFLWVSAKFGTCTVVSVNGTPVEAKLCTFTLESTHFIFNLCPIYTHDGASAKFSTNSQETDYSVDSLSQSWPSYFRSFRGDLRTNIHCKKRFLTITCCIPFKEDARFYRQQPRHAFKQSTVYGIY